MQTYTLINIENKIEKTANFAHKSDTFKIRPDDGTGSDH